MKIIKEYLKQIGIEIKNMFGTRGKIILVSLVLIGAVVMPLLGLINFGNNNNHNRYNEELVVNGITISPESPLYWEIQDSMYMKEEVEANATDEKSDLRIEYLDTLIDSYVSGASKIVDYNDYRRSLIYERTQALTTIFILDHIDLDVAALEFIINNQYMYYESAEYSEAPSGLQIYYDMSEIERMEKYEEAEEQIKLINEIIENDNHEAYYKYEIDNYNNQLADYKHQIQELEKDIIEKPENEEIYAETIKNYEENIKNIQETRLPIMEYRLKHDILPGSDKWQDNALNNKENALMSLKSTEVLSQEKFNADESLIERYKNYNDYKEAVEKQINELNEQLLIAENSLETQKPDMRYVQDGTRNRVTNFMFYSLLFAVIAAIISGNSIAREFQSGTIRLLLIRPKTRTKIALSKLFAIMSVLLVTYGISVILNLLTFGFIYGFADLAYPNYTISSGLNGISFFSFIVPKILACMVTILFGAAVAYLLSIVTRRAAVSVAIPLILFAGSLIFMSIVAYMPKFSWVIYTPAPYINMPAILTNQMYFVNGIEPNVGFGVSLLLALSVVFTALGTYFFNKKDIVN